MYDELFGLTGRPFQLTPDPAFWYETATHRRAMAYLGYGLAQGEGFIVITGDIGAGKTTLVGHLLDTLDREALNPIKLVSTAIEASDLLRIVATELGVDPAGLEKAQLLIAIERGLHAVARGGRRTLLIVDEAQALSVGALEELRMLSNFQAGGHALLQIVLLGQPEFRAALHGSEGLEQLRQRVIAIHHLEPMAASEVAAYVQHRLNVVGWSGRPGFADSAFVALHRYSDGVPRRLNQLANRVMLHAAVEGVATITAATIDHVAADLFADLPTMGQAAGDVRAVAAPAAVEEPVAVAPLPLAGGAGGGDDGAASAPSEGLSFPPPTPPASGRGEASVEPEVRAIAVEHESESAPRPFRHSWLAEESDSSAPAASPQLAQAPVEEAAAPDPRETPAFAGETVEVQASPDPDPALAARLAELETRMEEQDAALRRVLTLLVDWVEADQAPRSPAPAPEPALQDEPRGYVPIRGAAA